MNINEITIGAATYVVEREYTGTKSAEELIRENLMLEIYPNDNFDVHTKSAL